MRILITGGNGFIGSNFIRLFLKKDYVRKIVNVDKNSFESISDSFLNFKSNKYKKIKDDLSNVNKIEKILKDFKIDIILHMAAESHVDRSIKDPSIYVHSNIIPTSNLLLACNKLINKRKIRFIYFSTDEVFGSNHDTARFNLSSRLNPSSPYSASKAASGLLVQSWRKTFNLNASILYCCNNYGPYQNPEKLIPATFYRIINNLPILIYGDGKQIRTWIYVEDTIQAIEKIITSKKTTNEDFLIGSRKDYTNLKIIRELCNLYEKKLKVKLPKDIIKHTIDRPGHDKAYKLSVDKNLVKLGFNINFDLKIGLKETIDWYVSNPDFIENKKYTKFIGKLKKVGFK